MTKKELFEEVTRLNADDEIAVAIWTQEDVIQAARDRSMNISEETAKQIVNELHQEQDACEGINWNIIDNKLNEYME